MTDHPGLVALPGSRAALEEAIRIARVPADRMSLGAVCVSHDALKTVLAAAEAHLATLPKTRMIEVWRVEFAQHHLGKWTPLSATYDTEEEAKGIAREWHHTSGYRCICVTGPHQQCVPA